MIKIPMGSRGEYLWSRVPGFVKWFKENGGNYTNTELTEELKKRYGMTLNRAALESLRRTQRVTQSPETRQRAILARTLGYFGSKPDKDARTLREIQVANAKLMRQVDDLKKYKDELVRAVHDGSRDAALSLNFKVVPRPKFLPGPRGRADETAVLMVSDQQLGKKTPTYSTQVCEERMERYMDKVELLTKIQRSYHPVTSARLYLLGDIIEGELIFPGQAHRIDSSLFAQVSVDGPRIVGNIIRRALGLFDKVHVVGVIGNHGAIGGPSRREYHPESNGDLMLYRNVQTIFEVTKQDRLTFDIPYLRGERSWYSVDQIGEHKYFLFHGDQMRGGGFGGLPYYGFGRAINNWAAGVIPKGFKYALCGHWHQMASIPINDRILWINGSTESNNEWLREELKAQCPPGQWLLFAHPEHGVTAEYRVWL